GSRRITAFRRRTAASVFSPIPGVSLNNRTSWVVSIMIDDRPRTTDDRPWSHRLSVVGRPSSVVDRLPSGGRRRLARDLLVPHRRVVDESGHDDGSLLQVVRLDAVEHVLIRVV